MYLPPLHTHTNRHCTPQLCVCVCVQAYLWDSNEEVVEWLERQLCEDEGARSVVDENIKYIRRDHILKHIRRLASSPLRHAPWVLCVRALCQPVGLHRGSSLFQPVYLLLVLREKSTPPNLPVSFQPGAS